MLLVVGLFWCKIHTYNHNLGSKVHQKELQKAAEEDYEKVQDAKNRKAKEKQEKKEEEDRKEEMVKNLLNKKKTYEFFKGLTNMSIFTLFAILLILSVRKMALV